MLVCAIYDTHGHNVKTKWDIPECDMIIHAGDMTPHGSAESLALFARQMAELPARWKLCVFGNHDRIGEKDTKLATQILAKHGVIALTDERVDLCGKIFYGMPWIQLHQEDYKILNPDALNFSVLDISEHLAKIPRYGIHEEQFAMIDVLITHQPPHGIMDFVADYKDPDGHVVASKIPGRHIGSTDLAWTVEHKIKPRYHVFGHNHSGHGIGKLIPGSPNVWVGDGSITYINASLVDDDYKPAFEPIMFEV